MDHPDMVDVQDLPSLLAEGSAQVRALVEALEGVLGAMANSGPVPRLENGEGAGRGDRVRDFRNAYVTARDRLVEIVRDCEEAGTREEGSDIDEVTEEIVVDWMGLEKRKEELQEEIARKNKKVKGMIDVLRNMLSDVGMWECCGKSVAISKK